MCVVSSGTTATLVGSPWMLFFWEPTYRIVGHHLGWKRLKDCWANPSLAERQFSDLTIFYCPNGISSTYLLLLPQADPPAVTCIDSGFLCVDTYSFAEPGFQLRKSVVYSIPGPKATSLFRWYHISLLLHSTHNIHNSLHLPQELLSHVGQ